MKRAWFLGCILGVSVVLSGCGKDAPHSEVQEPVASATSQAPQASDAPVQHTPSAVNRQEQAQQPDGFSIVRVAELPRQAAVTLQRIEADGPFPYGKDGVVFGNHERMLPWHPCGYYHE